ncbi:MAG: hypothetical protein RUMPE_01031 [Eubacteriales bacterium SKADARSKE-1]|nr:hypothetical protein [Eubacteriales bacterium SKADARSKE-1]
MGKKLSLFKTGLKDGYPIGFGYLPLAFTLGIGASNMGLKLPVSIAMSMLSFTGVGQLTAMDLISRGESYVGFFLALLVINLRNIVLSLSMAQKLEPKTSLGKKLVLAMGNTDEIFALTIRREGKLPANYLLGVMTLPYAAWFVGAFVGSVAGDVLPPQITIAMKMALYAMLIASVVPAIKESRPILYVAVISGLLSCVLKWLRPLFTGESGFEKVVSGLLSPSGVLIIGSLVSAGIIGALFPVISRGKEEQE